MEGTAISSKRTGFTLTDDDCLGGQSRHTHSMGGDHALSSKTHGFSHADDSDRVNSRMSMFFGPRVVFLLAVVVLLLIGVGGVGFKQLYEKLQSQTMELQKVNLVLHAMEEVVAETGMVLDQTGSEARLELKEVNSEIRKLWDVSNKRNRRWIEANQEALEKLDKRVSSDFQVITDATVELKKIKTMTTEHQELAKQMRGVSIELVGEAAKMDGIQKQTDQIDKRMDKIEDKIKDYQEAIESVDNFRVQMNRKIQQLEQMMRKLSPRS